MPDTEDMPSPPDLTDPLSELACAVVAAQAALDTTTAGTITTVRIALRGVTGASRRTGFSAGLMLGMLPLGIGVQVLHEVEASRGVWIKCELRQMPQHGTEGTGA